MGPQLTFLRKCSFFVTHMKLKLTFSRKCSFYVTHMQKVGQAYTTTHTLALYKDHDHHHYRQTEKHKREQPTQGLVSITATPQKPGDGLEGGGGTL